MRRHQRIRRLRLPSIFAYPSRLVLLLLASAIALPDVGSSGARAENIFALDEVINLRSFFGEGGVLIDEEEPRFEWAGPVALDPLVGHLYVAGPDGLGIIDEANRQPLGWLQRTEIGPGPTIGFQSIAAMAVQPATGDLFVYNCAPCRDENIGAQFAVVTPRLPNASSLRRFEPLRTTEQKRCQEPFFLTGRPGLVSGGDGKSEADGRWRVGVPCVEPHQCADADL